MRSLYESLFMTLRALASHKLRTVLTMTGISIGIFAITVIFTLVNTLQYSVSKNLAELGNTVMYVHNWPWRDNSQDWFKYFNRPKVSYKDYAQVKQNVKNVVGVSYEIRKSLVTVKAPNGNNVTNITLYGITADYSVINGLKLETGRFFTNLEIEAGRPVCILGMTIADALYPMGNAVGQTINVQGKRLMVVGVMQREGTNLFGSSRDELVLLPYGVITRMINENSRFVDKLIAVKATEYKLLDEVESEVIGNLRAARGLRPGKEDNFSINRQEMLMSNIGQVFGVLNTGGSVIAFFSLLVGGFGIASIMFVAVKERTSEIGVQKALGATRGFILSQFLIESIILSVIGGAIGIFFMLIVAGLAQLILNSAFPGIEVVVTIADIVKGMLIAVFIGVTFGFIPARSAAKLDPVEAMRQQ